MKYIKAECKSFMCDLKEVGVGVLNMNATLRCHSVGAWLATSKTHMEEVKHVQVLSRLLFSVFPLNSDPGGRPSDEHDGPVQTHRKDRRAHGTLPWPGPQLHEGHSIRQHQLRRLRVPQDCAGRPVEMKEGRTEAHRGDKVAKGCFFFFRQAAETKDNNQTPEIEEE